MNGYALVPLIERRDLNEGCISLLNEEWPRSYGAREHSQEKSCRSSPPLSLLLIETSPDLLVGHARICHLPNRATSCWIESVIIRRTERGKGLGKLLMKLTEQYAARYGFNQAYLSTEDQQRFYKRCGYECCEPVTHSSAATSVFSTLDKFECNVYSDVKQTPTIDPSNSNDGCPTDRKSSEMDSIQHKPDVKSSDSSFSPPPPPPPPPTSQSRTRDFDCVTSSLRICMATEKDIKWMYEGAKSSVNREDYLLGKRLDKNFEKYSDAVKDEKPDRIDAIAQKRTQEQSVTGLKVSTLEKDIIRTEDPLVAVKVREETKRREMLDNPVMKLKFQKMLKVMMDAKEKKKAKKADKKKKKKKRKHRSSDSSDEDQRESKKSKTSKSERRHSNERRKGDAGYRRSRSHSPDRRAVKRKIRSPDSRRNIITSRERSRSCSSSRSIPGKDRYLSPSRHQSRGNGKQRRNSSHRRSESTERHRRRSRSRSLEEVHSRRKRENGTSRNRHDSSSSDEPSRNRRLNSNRPRDGSSNDDDEKKKKRKKQCTEPEGTTTRSFDSHIPEHLRPKISAGSSSSSESSNDSDDESRKQNMDVDSDVEEKRRKRATQGFGLVQMKVKEEQALSGTADNPYQSHKLPVPTVYKKPERSRPLTEEEKAERLRAMQANANWREETRNANVRKAVEEAKQEEEESDRSRGPSFIRSEVNDASMSIEKRLQSNKKSLQRSHGYMERKFAAK